MKWLAGGFSLAIIAIVIAADRGQLPSFIVALYRFPGGDKVGHFLLMGLLAGLVNLALPLGPPSQPRGAAWSKQPTLRSLLLGNGAVLLIVTLEELSQGLFSNRTLSWLDWLSSLAGMVCFGYAAWRWRSAGVSRHPFRAAKAP